MGSSAAAVIVKPSETSVVRAEAQRGDKASAPPSLPANPPAPVAAGGRRFLAHPRWEAGVTDF